MKSANTPNGTFQLVKPTIALKDSYIAGLRELQAEGLPWYQSLDLANLEFSEVRRHPQHDVLETRRWGLWNGEFAGVIGIRHELNDSLRTLGGHIGYDTVPSKRGHGIASAMLRDALPIAKQIGLTEVLITCDDTNTASIKVIEKNGGVLKEKRSLDPSRPLKRYYWIKLSAQTSCTSPNRVRVRR